MFSILDPIVKRAPLGICGVIFIQTKYPSLTRESIEALSRERDGLTHKYNDIISVENLLTAWREFLRGKRKRQDIAEFSLHLTDNILVLHRELVDKTYKHGNYQEFKISDPKPRVIHKATVRDRLLHHALYRVLYPYFDRLFISDSYSCRKGKGTHKAINRLREYGRKVSYNNTRTVWILKCDIRKFFANIDHTVLKEIMEKNIEDKDIMWLLSEIINSFCTNNIIGVGLPLGNLTSQLLINIYMNDFDQFVKHKLKLKYYVRYADDFVVLSESKSYVDSQLTKISEFLENRLKLSLHPDKVFIKTLASGVDFLGWVHFPHHRVLRTATKRRMFKRLKRSRKKETTTSYLGLLKHGNTYKLVKMVDKETKIVEEH